MQHTTLFDRFSGCLLAGACGDALGAAVEFTPIEDIRRLYGPDGIRNFASVYDGYGRITDDTQMTLFTADALIRGSEKSSLGEPFDWIDLMSESYQRWLLTQGRRNQEIAVDEDGWLFEMKEIHDRRAPGHTCLDSLEVASRLGEPALNDSKGCGGVMRVAPIALASNWSGTGFDPAWSFDIGRKSCALTHGHPTGQLAGGYFSAFLSYLLRGESKISAANKAMHLLARHADHEETLEKVRMALELAQTSPGNLESIRHIGEGWTAEEALAIGLYCALSTDSTEDAIILSVNHSGDSDSTGSITGNIMGLLHGKAAIPERWLSQVELKDAIERIARNLSRSENAAQD